MVTSAHARTLLELKAEYGQRSEGILWIFRDQGLQRPGVAKDEMSIMRLTATGTAVSALGKNLYVMFLGALQRH